MGTPLEDGLYIFRCTVLNESGLHVSDSYLNWPNYEHRLNKDRAVRTRVRNGIVYFQGQDFLRHYRDYRGSEYDCYTFITEPDQLRTDLLPYPERS